MGVTQIELPEGLSRIEGNAFLNKDLASLRIPASVEYIGVGAIAACWSLSKVDVDPANKYYKSEGNVIYTINSKNAVASAYLRDETVYVLHGVETIEDNVFAGDFVQLYLPATLKKIGGAFNSSALNEVTCYAKEPPVLSSTTFFFSELEDATLYVVEGCAEQYRQVDGWSRFGRIVEISKDAIETINKDEAIVPRNIYNLSGYRISNTSSLKPGFYIVNGKKYVVK